MSLKALARASPDSPAHSNPTGQRSAHRWGLWLSVVLIAAVLSAAAWLGWQGIGGWEGGLLWLWQTQQDLHRHLAQALRAVAAQGMTASVSLLALSLAYGVFHAAGPGHGKAVIATYLGSQRVQLRRGLGLSLCSALAQGVVAIAVVEAIELAVAALGWSLRRAHALGGQVELASFVLIALLGLVLLARNLWALGHALWLRLRPPRGTLFALTGARGWQAYCAECGRLHGPSRAQLNQLKEPWSWRTGAAIVLAIGLRPCTGAVLVLLVAHSLGLRWTGMAAVFAMSLGTAATVAVLAVLTVSARQTALRLLQRRTPPQYLSLGLNLLGALGGGVILLMGLGLLLQGLASPAHPLL